MNDAFVFGVDLDGVCGDYTAAFRAVVASETDQDPATLSDDRDWSFSQWGLDAAGFERLHRTAVLEHRMFRSMPPVPGVAEALWALSDLGVWIRLITHRLYVSWGHATAIADTVSWLDDVGIPYRDICFLGQKPHVEADLYVDDAPHNVLALRAGGSEVVVFDQPYNRHLPGPRAADWGTLAEMVREALVRHRPLQEQLPGLPVPNLRHRKAGKAPMHGENSERPHGTEPIR